MKRYQKIPLPTLAKYVGALGQFCQTAEGTGGHDAWRCSPCCFLYLLCWMFHQTIQSESLYIIIYTFELSSTSWRRNGSRTSLRWRARRFQCHWVSDNNFTFAPVNVQDTLEQTSCLCSQTMPSLPAGTMRLDPGNNLNHISLAGSSKRCHVHGKCGHFL